MTVKQNARVVGHKKAYLTSEGKLALVKIAAATATVIGATAFLVAPRRRDWRTSSQWKQLEKHRYAHRGLFEEPPSAQAYPKGTAGDPWKDEGSLLTVCRLYQCDADDDPLCVDFGGRRPD